MVDGGGDFLDVVQEAGAAGGPHSRPAQRFLGAILFGLGFMGVVGGLGIMG